MRLVLDTNVVVSGSLWNETPRLLLEAGRQRRIELFTSRPLLAELTDVFNRRNFERKIVASLLTVDQIVDRDAALATLVRPETTPRIAPDPEDDVVIGTALATKADVIVTGDSPLLDLKSYQGILITTAASAVERIG